VGGLRSPDSRWRPEWTTIITLLEKEVVVEKRLRAIEEVRITKRRTTPAGRRSMSRYDARRRWWSALR
jgi:hypothetical protein